MVHIKHVLLLLHFDLDKNRKMYFHIINYILRAHIWKHLYMYAWALKEKQKEEWDSVLWQKLLYKQQCQNGSDNTNNATKKFDYTAITTDLGRLDGVTIAIKLVKYNEVQMYLIVHWSTMVHCKTLPNTEWIDIEIHMHIQALI